MKSTEFRRQLAILGWSQGRFADWIGVHPNSVSAWSTGAVTVPRYVEVLLDLVITLHSVQDKLLRPRK